MAEVRVINWFRSWPGHYTFTLLAVVLSLLIGVSAFLYQHSMVWTPMEHTYLTSYIGSGIVALSPFHTRGTLQSQNFPRVRSSSARTMPRGRSSMQPAGRSCATWECWLAKSTL